MAADDDDSEGKETRPPEGGADEPHPLQGIAAAYILVGSLALGLGIGYGLDQIRDTEPWWTLASAVFFLIVGFYHIVRSVL